MSSRNGIIDIHRQRQLCASLALNSFKYYCFLRWSLTSQCSLPA